MGTLLKVQTRALLDPLDQLDPKVHRAKLVIMGPKALVGVLVRLETMEIPVLLVQKAILGIKVLVDQLEMKGQLDRKAPLEKLVIMEVLVQQGL